MKAKSCRVCGAGEDRLKAKWDSGSGLMWVHCDVCGNHSTPVTKDPLDRWNAEQERKDVEATDHLPGSFS